MTPLGSVSSLLQEVLLSCPNHVDDVVLTSRRLLHGLNHQLCMSFSENILPLPKVSVSGSKVRKHIEIYRQ